MADPMSAPKTVAKPSRVIRVVLILSLALNLAFVGGVAGLALRGGPSERGLQAGGAGTGTGGPLARALPHDVRKELGRDMRDFARSIGLRRSNVRENMNRLADIVEAAPFDAAVLAAELEAQKALVGQLQANGRDLMIQTVTGMSDSARQEMAQELRRIAKRGPRALPRGPKKP